MTTTYGQYYDTLPDGRVLIVSPMPDGADDSSVRVLWQDRDEITADQRKKIFAIVKDIAVSQMEDPEYTRRNLTADFLRKNMEQLQMSAISLAIGGTCDKGTASLYIDYLINLCMEYNIQTAKPLTEYADDLEKYTYAALMHKRCIVCGRQADLHHVDQVGMGYNRETKPQIGALVMPLCREHHGEYHSIGRTAFEERYHAKPVPLTKQVAGKYHTAAKPQHEREGNMIKPVDEIPMNIAQKRESYRDQIRSDIHEAMDKGIKKFEFVGDYKYKYLAKYVREEADRIIRDLYVRTIQEHPEELEDVRTDYYKVREKIRFIITVTAVMGEDKDKPRVFCEIAEKAPEDIIMDAIRQYDLEYRKQKKARAEREEKRRKLMMEANDETETFDFSEELP